MPRKKQDTLNGSFAFPPEASIGFLVRDTHRAFSRVLGAAIADAGVTIGMWFFLRALWEEDGLTQRELSRRIGMTEPTTVSAPMMPSLLSPGKRVPSATMRAILSLSESLSL